MKTYFYQPNISGYADVDVDHAYAFNSERDIRAFGDVFEYDDLEVTWLVEDMASDYMRNHDGWEVARNWEGDYRDFVVWNENKELIGTFEVLLEYSPTFTAWKKK